MSQQNPCTHLLGRARRFSFLFVCVAVLCLFVISTPALGSLIQNSLPPDWGSDTPHDFNPVATPGLELLISKEAETWASAPVAPGGMISYTLICENVSEMFAQTDVYVREPIPAHTRFISGAVSGGDQVEYSWDGGATWTTTLPITTTSVTHIRWYDAQVPTNTQATVGFAVQVTATLPPGASIQNTAHISSTRTGLYSGDWIPSNPVEVQTVDLWVEKSVHQPTVWAGNLVSYTISYGNQGSGDVAGVQITDTLPASVTYSAGSIWGTGADDSGEPILVWDMMTVTAGTGVQQVGYAVVLSSDIVSGTIVTNTAAISSAYGITSSDPATVTVATAADLSIAKSESPDPVVAGTILTYTLNYINDGPSDAQGITITDTLPLDVAYGGEVSVTPSLFGPTQTGQLFTWYTPTLAAGAGGTIVFTVTVEPGAGSGLTNDATIASSTPELNASNNVAAAYTAVIRETDLEIAKIGRPDPVVAGTTLNYTLVITNHGPSDSTGARIFDILPRDVSFNSAASSQSCVELAPDTIACDVDGVDVGGSTTLQIVVNTASSLAEGANLTNWALVIGSETDPNSKNDGITIDTMIGREVDLVISKSDFPDPVIAATALTYTLTIANYGPSDAANIRLSDVLPDGVAFSSTASSLGCIEPTPGAVSCNVASVAANDNTLVTIVVIVDSSLAEGTILTNQAFVISDEGDSEPSDNGISENTRVIRRTDLAILKSDYFDPAIAGTTLTYTLAYTNSGPLDAPSVAIVDTLPGNVTYGGIVTCSASLDDPDQAGSQLTWDIPMLAVGEGGTIVFTVTVDPGTSGIITNSANIVSSVIPDHNSSNNNASEPTTIIRRADLTIDKASSPDPVVAGEMLTYTLAYTNSGPSDAQGIVITDTLPADVTYGGVASSMLGDPTRTDQKLAWCAPTLAAGASGNVVFTVTVGADVRGIITNCVVITSVIPDPNLSDNDKDEPTLVEPALVITKTMVDLNGAPLYSGDVVEYRVLARNVSDIRSQTHVTITDPMPSNIVLIVGSITCTPGATCGESKSGRSAASVGGSGPSDDGGMATASIESLEPGGILTLTFRAMVINGVSAIGENVAVVESDSQSELESDPVGSPVEPGLVIVKSAVDVNGALLEAGDTVAYHIVVTNTSDTYAHANVIISDTIPANTTLAARSVVCSSGAICGESEGMVTAAVGDLAPGDVVTLTFRVTLDNVPIGGNVAVAKSDTQNEQWTGTIYPPGANWRYIYLPLVTRGYR